MLLIEDNVILRIGMTELLRREKDMTVVGASDTQAKNAINKIRKLKPTVVLLDLSMRSQQSLQLVQNLKKEFPRAKLILMDISPAPGDALRLARGGASGFVIRAITVPLFLRTIRSIAEGKRSIPKAEADSLFVKSVEYYLTAEKAKRARTSKAAASKSKLAVKKAVKAKSKA